MDFHHRPCHACDAVISRHDLREGLAVIVMKQPYCRSCTRRISMTDGSALTVSGARSRLYAAAAITVALVALLYFLAVQSPR
jgi:hypothetical protein